MKLYLISYPKIPNSSCLGNFFILKIMIENRNFSKIAPFATLPFWQYHVCILSTSDKKSCKRKLTILNLSRKFKTRFSTKSQIFEKKTVKLRNRQCCEGRNFRKIAIFNHKFNNEKLPKLDELGIEGYGIKLSLNKINFWTNWLVIFYFMNEKPQFLLYPREAMGLLY